MKQVVVTLLFAILAAGCQTAAGPDLYTLNMEPSEAAGSPVNIAVGRLRVAEPLQNKRLLIKKSPTEVEYYAAVAWAASLEELLAEKLTVEFGPFDPARKTFVLSGQLLAFEQVDTPDGGIAHIRFAVEIREEGTSHYSTPALAKTYDVRQPADAPVPGDLVKALSAGLEQVARLIVNDVSAL